MESNECCYLSEIYSAIQGEGPLVGVRQIFIRFSACDLRCVWCDTPESLVKTDSCQVENGAGSRSFEKVQNPVSKPQLISFIEKLSPALHQSISLTGGEPLLQSKFLSLFLPNVKQQINLPVYLETGGHRVNELKEIINYIDYVSMDFKLPSSSKTRTLWKEHKEFLKISLSAKNLQNIWVKIVLTNETSFGELIQSINIVKSLSTAGKNIEIILQPVTQINGSQPPSKKDLLNIHLKLLEHYSYIRILPQVHKLIGQK
ncbi:MAG: 7-carboxy-7-deazaguanine synthase QueE [Candidatus Melainabacteria bacterium]|nr:7-carboxy-7-deazaguanine synthase QueE [Candidatus Melainabacteria bacterium]